MNSNWSKCALLLKSPVFTFFTAIQDGSGGRYYVLFNLCDHRKIRKLYKAEKTVIVNKKRNYNFLHFHIHQDFLLSSQAGAAVLTVIGVRGSLDF